MSPIKSYNLETRSLENFPQRDQILSVLRATLEAVDPMEAVQKHCVRIRNQLIIQNQSYDLQSIKRIFLIGAGKASAPMAFAMAQMIKEKLSGGLILVKDGHKGDFDWDEFPNLKIIEAGHPLPDERGLNGARTISELLQATKSDDLVINLISGGGSALLTLPREGLELSDLQEMTNLLLTCGASIQEINTLRKHLEQLKGGQLARLAAPAKVVSLILSDVVGNPLNVIASGPTVSDPTTFEEADAILKRYGLPDKVPSAISTILKSGMNGKIPETPKPSDMYFKNVQNVIIASNEIACQAACEQAQNLGMNTLLLTTYLQGEARQAGRFLAAIAREIASRNRPLARPACLVAGGETTVNLIGNGLGGRNTEIALSAVEDLCGLNDVFLVALATDGGDGPTDAAGAVVNGQTWERARQRGLFPQEYLATNDSYHFFEKLGDLLKTGPTLTNVNDIALLFAF